MTEPILTLPEYTRVMDELGRMARTARDEIDKAVDAAAEAERAYRVAKALAWSKAEGKTVPEREAWVNAETAVVRAARDVAKGRIETARAAHRDLDSQRRMWDVRARWSMSQQALVDRPGPNLTPMARNAA